jgi:hypothetical protein
MYMDMGMKKNVFKCLFVTVVNKIHTFSFKMLYFIIKINILILYK